MADETLIGLEEYQRKRYHREDYEFKRGRSIYRDYRINIVNGHLLTGFEGLSILVDTGTPISIGKVPEFYFLNRLHRLSSGYMGVTMDYLERMVGTPIDVMLGMDILKDQFITIDLPTRRLLFSENSRPNFSNRIPMTALLGTPSIDVAIDGTIHRVVVDTGAKLSYVDKSIAANHPVIGKEVDFYPGLGEFETPVYDIPFELEGESFSLRCGVLPEMLETALRVTGNTGIIRSELYQKFIVCLAFPECMLYLEKIR